MKVLLQILAAASLLYCANAAFRRGARQPPAEQKTNYTSGKTASADWGNEYAGNKTETPKTVEAKIPDFPTPAEIENHVKSATDAVKENSKKATTPELPVEKPKAPSAVHGQISKVHSDSEIESTHKGQAKSEVAAAGTVEAVAESHKSETGLECWNPKECKSYIPGMKSSTTTHTVLAAAIASALFY
eukprot:gnl/MRDRNA2_/MRDRNA2_96860_c0_seq1.p1 gnl/MRDRNA2_/MRDRNA2_96860_c0~~gnl/MRDRNA2_/MRDRNA2_96860_c0_seq1.p1  ORF type:complete len:188 (+),score=39.96 gnl/MRDRNA2_/MRDRNA2_96860_c0_seq1:60-623(+)